MLELGTFLLAVATTALAVQAYLDRIERRHAWEQSLLRSAVLEQVDNARAWSRINPNRGGSAIAAHHDVPDTRRLSELLDGLTLPNDLTAYLIYERARIIDLGARHRKAIEDPTGADAYGLWWSLLDEVQVVACLLRAHAHTAGHLKDVADGVPTTWETVEPGVPAERAFNSSARFKTGEAPSWPARSAYAACAPAVRDAAGAAEAARQQNVLSESLQGALRR